MSENDWAPARVRAYEREFIAAREVFRQADKAYNESKQALDKARSDLHTEQREAGLPEKDPD